MTMGEIGCFLSHYRIWVTMVRNPHEEVDMPVFFYIDPEITADPALEHCDTITLSYTFFEAKEGLKLNFPSYAKPHAATA